MLFAKGHDLISEQSMGTEIVGAIAMTLLPLCFLAWILFLASFRRHGAKQVLVAFATGSLLGLLLGSVYAFFQWHSHTKESGQLIEETIIECFVRKPLPALSAGLGVWVSWLSLLTFGKRMNKTDRG